VPASELGPWGRIYFRIGLDKAHYSLEALGAFLKVWAAMGLVTPRGRLKRRAVVGLIGEALTEFLIFEGDLVEDSDGVLTMHRWDWYQAPLEANRQRQKSFRERSSAPSVDTVDNVTSSDRNVTVTSTSRDAPPSPSIDIDTKEKKTNTSYPTGELDSLDRYYELTRLRPWGKRSGRWLAELQEAHGVVNVVAALEVEFAADPDRELISRTAARLEAQAHRISEAKKREPKPVDPVQAEFRAAYKARYGPEDAEPAVDTSPEAIAAGRAAFEGLRASLRGGPVLHSRSNGSDPAESLASRPDPALTVDEGSGSRVNGGDVLPGVENADRAPSPPRTGAAVDPMPNRARSEPGRSEAPTVGVEKESGHA
jgi:hypothetical protein